jgi:hypothetical protein
MPMKLRYTLHSMSFLTSTLLLNSLVVIYDTSFGNSSHLLLRRTLVLSVTLFIFLPTPFDHFFIGNLLCPSKEGMNSLIIEFVSSLFTSFFTTHDSRLTTHDSRLTTHDSRLTTHDSRLTTHHSSLILQHHRCFCQFF